VLEYLAVGASAVQVGTASFSDPRASEAIVGDLEQGLEGLNAFAFSEIRDKFSTETG
jgi:dihydroorotate dehydrogenase